MVKRILITDHYPLNKGIAAVLITTLISLKKCIPDAVFTIVSYLPEKTRAPFTVKVVPELVRISSGIGPNKMLSDSQKILRSILAMIGWVLLRRINNALANCFVRVVNAELIETLHEYAEADVVISAGGILDPTAGSTGYGTLVQLYNVFVSKLLLKKKVVLFAYSILSFHDLPIIYRLLAKQILNMVNLITVRDRISHENLTDLGVTRPNIRVTADPALLLAPERVDKIDSILAKEGIRKKNHLVGITVSDFFNPRSLRYHYPGSADPRLQHEKYVKTISQVADYLISDLDCSVVFIPMEVNTEGYSMDDRPLILQICKMMTNKKDAKVITNDYTPEELKGILGQMDLLIGTRMHSLLFAAPMHVPMIGIAYETKVKAFMERIGQEKWVCDLQDMNLETMQTLISEILPRQGEIRRILRLETDYLKRSALANAVLVARFLRAD